MKEYQVVTVGRKSAIRNGRVCFERPDGNPYGEWLGFAEVLEIVLNRYEQDGWSVNKLFHMDNYSWPDDCRILVVFERGLSDRDGKELRGNEACKDSA